MLKEVLPAFRRQLNVRLHPDALFGEHERTRARRQNRQHDHPEMPLAEQPA